MPCDDELALRAHIRELLLEYAYTHLTVDYVEYSHSLVSDILDKILKPIPTHEPGQLVLPTDAFDDLKKKFKFDNLIAYDEILEPDPETMQLLKRTYSAPKRRSRTQTVWEEEDDFEYETLPHRPMTPVLSRSSRNKTPSLGKKVQREPLASFVSSRGIQSITNEDVPEKKPVKIEDCLDAKLAADPSIVKDIDKCIQGNPFLCRAAPITPSHTSEFLRSVSPVYEEKFRPISPPVFPRAQSLRPSKAKSEESILGQINLAPVEVDEDDPDIANANMSIIDGWTTIPTSTSTPSLSSGASDVDELEEEADFWKPSSEGGSGDKPMLHAAKMDEPIFPRAERPRAGRMIKADGSQKLDLSSFISSRLPRNSMHRVYACPDSDDAARTLSGPPSVTGFSGSMLGQPPSESDVPSASPGHSAGDALDREVRKMLKAHDGYAVTSSYQDIIMNERLDDKESMFMDVPNLPPPNDYLRKGRGKEATEPGSKSGDILNLNKPNFVLPITLKKVSGLKSLNLELSWRPFSYGAKIPTHIELLGVESPLSVDDDFLDERNSPMTSDTVEKILAGLNISTNFEDQAQSINTIDGTNERFLKDILSDIDLGSIYPRFDPNRDFDDENTYLLSRFDRRALAMHPLNQHHTTANEILPFDDSQSNDTLDCSSAITPEFDAHFPGTQNIIENGAFTNSTLKANAYGRSPFDHNGNCNDYFAYDEQDNSHLKKRRRLTSAELDALCAMETMSQSYSLTVDPRDLTLPSTDVSCTPEHNNDLPPAIPAQNSQCTLASSESLSLSLSEDDLLHKSLPLKVADDCMTIAGEAHEAYGKRGVVLDILEETISDELPAPLDQQERTFILDRELQQHQQLDASKCTLVNLEGFTLETQPPRPVADQQGVSRTGKSGLQNSGNSMHLKNLEGPQRTTFSAPPRDNYSLSTFLHARGRKNIATSRESALVPENPQLSCNARDTEDDHARDESYQVYHTAPPDLLSGTRAFTISDTWEPPTTEHAYLVSIDLLQQLALVRVLESQCAVQLRERDTVSTPFIPVSVPISPQSYSAEISLIVGPDAGVVFFPLSALPSQNAYKTLLDALSYHSWRFSHVLLVLMAFPRSRLMRAVSLDEEDRDGPSSYSPPALKAARRVRRDLGLREGTGEKSTGCTVELAFSDDVEHAAKLVRAFGDVALGGSVVDYTQYIGEEEQEGERDLAELDGMNTYCATVILRCCTLGEFLEMPSEQRTEGLADLIGRERIEHVNSILNRRIQAMNMDLPSSSEFSSLN